MDRRAFVRLCSSTLAIGASTSTLLAQSGGVVHHYKQVVLTTGQEGKPLKASALEPGITHIFHYPFAGTPCFLIDLGKPAEGAVLKSADGQTYNWPGGVGKEHSVVAFSAICPHQLSYPSKRQSFINYVHGNSKVAGRSRVIVCCAHHSVYDPTQGGKAIAGPAPKPLTTILLEHDARSDSLRAIGTYGDELFDDYFRAYKRELIEEFGRGAAKQEVQDSALVLPLTSYTQKQIRC